MGNYRKGELASHFVKVPDAPPPGTPLFKYSERLEPFEGLMYATAALNQPYVRLLRSRMPQSFYGSIGCPVARHSVLISKEMFDADPHLQRMVERDELEIIAERSNDKKVRLMQEQSTIDRTLAFFAGQLDQYEQLYGTPRLSIVENWGEKKTVIEHHCLRPVEALRWPATEQQMTSENAL